MALEGNFHAFATKLIPCCVGLAVIIVAVSFIGYEMLVTQCQAPSMVQAMVLLVIPIVYLVLMYLTLSSQE
jgi:hypothetical protein